jgi:AAA15 family ATPase/GTPase
MRNMLDSINIKNYRNLKDIRLTSLGRVNLITGRNNTGKSTLLEAIAIYATKADLSFIYQLLGDRGEDFRQMESNKNVIEANIKAISSLFTDRIIGFEKSDAISISSNENTLFGIEEFLEKSVGIRFVRYFDKVQLPDKGSINTLIRTERSVVENIADNQLEAYKIGLEIRAGRGSYILSLDEDRPYRFGFKGFGNNERLEFIRTRNIDRDINGRLWDNIILSEKEQYVIDALRIIEPNTERIAFIEEQRKERSAVIKLTNNNSNVPLKSMGDGINRILTIILALVNADGGFLLIDEFENGLHHTVQEKLWDIIFNLSNKLNIQVFVTTHSEDCISGFDNILNSPGNSLDGKLIRLDNNNGIIKQVEFDAKELKIANEYDIEIR